MHEDSYPGTHLCLGSAAAIMKCSAHSLAANTSEPRNRKTAILTCRPIHQHKFDSCWPQATGKATQIYMQVFTTNINM